MDDLLKAIDEVLILLGECIPRPEYLNRFESCKKRLIDDPADKEALQELSVISAPRGFLGDGPLYPKSDSKMEQYDINKVRWELVERINGAIDRQKA